MPEIEQETEAAVTTDVTVGQDELEVYPSTDDVTSSFLRELMQFVVDNVSMRFDNIDTYHKTSETLLTSIDTEFVSFHSDLDYLNQRVDVMYNASLWNMMLQGLISGILFVLVFTGGRK